MAKNRDAGRSDKAAYCNSCPVNTGCWDRHRAHVREYVPALAALADDISKTHQGMDYIREFQKQTEQTDGGSFTEPFMAVMMGNMEDGARVAGGFPPKERGTSTLTWPLQTRRPVP
jgi:hypothetical protein